MSFIFANIFQRAFSGEEKEQDLAECQKVWKIRFKDWKVRTGYQSYLSKSLLKKWSFPLRIFSVNMKTVEMPFENKNIS